MTRGRTFLAILMPVGAAALLVWMATWETPSGPDLASGSNSDSNPVALQPAGGASRPGEPGDDAGQPRRQSADPSEIIALDGSRTGDCSLAGLVQDLDGRALSGVSVSLLRARTGLISVRQPLGIEVQTSGTGAFLFEQLNCGALLSLEFRSPGKALHQHGPVRLKPGQITRIPVVQLERGLTLTGLVRSSLDLAPVPDATVMVERIDRPDGLLSTVHTAALVDTTDARGRFDIEGVGHIQYRIRAEAPGYAPKELQRSFLASRHLDSIELTLQLEPAAEAVVGEVLDSRGQPIAGALIVARTQAGESGTHQVRATADEAGQFSMAGLSSAKYSFRATMAGHSQLEDAQWIPGQDRVKLRLVKNGGLRGRAIAADGSTPLGLAVEVVKLDPEGRQSLIKRARPDDVAGHFLAEDLAPGIYHLWVSADNSSNTLSGQFELQAGETLEGLTVRMAAGGAILGTVQDGDGEALGGAEVLLMPKNLDPELEQTESLLRLPLHGKRARSDLEGRFRLAHIPPGEYKLRLLGGGGTTLVHPVRVSEDESTDLGSIRIDRGGLLEGTALGQDGKALERNRIVLISKQAGYRVSVLTDGQGRFSMSSLPAGSYRVSISLPESFDPYAYEHEASAQVESDTTTTVTVRIRRRS